MKDKFVNACKKFFTDKSNLAFLPIILIVVLVMMIIFEKENPLFGTYKMDGLIYLNDILGVAEEEVEENIEEAVVAVAKDGFVFVIGDTEEWIDAPKYKTVKATEALLEEIKNATTTDKFIAFDLVEKIHYIYGEDGKATSYMLLETKADMWLVQYYYIMDKMDVWYIYDLGDKQ